MTVAEGVFYLIAAVAIIGAIGVVTVPNVVHAAMFLVVSLLAVAGFYILLSNEFLALTQVLVYAGGIAILIMFGLMLTRGSELPTVSTGAQWPAAIIVTLAIAAVLLTAVVDSDWPRDAGEVTYVSIQSLGMTLFREWLLPFEIASVILLVALIGAVVLSRQEEGEA